MVVGLAPNPETVREPALRNGGTPASGPAVGQVSTSHPATTCVMQVGVPDGTSPKFAKTDPEVNVVPPTSMVDWVMMISP
jgi:hypothetical protein